MTTIATIGFFDGVHRGHQFVVDTLMAAARQNGQRSMVVTFARHPRSVLQPAWHPQLLTTPEEKRSRLLDMGIDECLMLDFNAETAAMTAEQFLERLHRQHGVTRLLMGYDNRFGHRQPGVPASFDDYRRWGAMHGVEVDVLPCHQPAMGQPLSSSAIRQALAAGDILTANQLLGYRYALSGEVVEGHGEGHRLGFPTANLRPDHPDKLIPQEGVYAVAAAINGADGTQTWHPAMMNIGHRPTYNGHEQTLEAHLLGYDGNLYGQSLTIRFMARLRSEQRFDTPEQLRAQLENDRRQVSLLYEQQAAATDAGTGKTP